MDSLFAVTARFAFVLALALLLERAMEVLKSSYDLLDSRLDLNNFWTKRAYRTRGLLEKKLRGSEHAGPKYAARVLRRFSEMLLNGQGGYSGSVPVLSGDLVRTRAVKVGLKVVAITSGIALAFAYGIDLVALWNGGHAATGEPSSFGKILNSQGVHYILSGTAIGLGSGPVHKVITTIEKKRKRQKEKADRPGT